MPDRQPGKVAMRIGQFEVTLDLPKRHKRFPVRKYARSKQMMERHAHPAYFASIRNTDLERESYYNYYAH